MPEMRVSVEGFTDSHGDSLSVRSDGSLTVSTIPEGALPYTTLIENVAVVNTANNYLSVFNPVGSGKTLTFAQFVAFPYATAATTPTLNMDVKRISAASAGTLLAAANVNKFDTAQPNSIAEVRTGNPTVTTVGTVSILAIPPAITSAASGVSSTISIIPPSGALFVCHPGEGVVVTMAAGAGTTQVWSLGFTWLEL